MRQRIEQEGWSYCPPVKGPFDVLETVVRTAGVETGADDVTGVDAMEVVGATEVGDAAEDVGGTGVAVVGSEQSSVVGVGDEGGVDGTKERVRVALAVGRSHGGREETVG